MCIETNSLLNFFVIFCSENAFAHVSWDRLQSLSDPV